MRLQDKFKRSFIFPLICGIITSIILTIVILVFNSKSFSNDDMINRLQKIEDEKTHPIIITVNNFLYKKIQKQIYSLQIFKKYFFLYSKSLPKDFDYTLLQNHLENPLNIKKNNFEYITKIQNINNNHTYLDRAFWFYDNQNTPIKSLAVKNPNLTKQLQVLSHMIPLLRSVYEVSEDNLANRIDLIYFANKNTDLFFGYPLYKNNPDFYSVFEKFENPTSCKNIDNINPNYFYFKCRDWWKQIIEAVADPNEQQHDIVVTHPYKFAGMQKYGITICTKFLDPFESNNDIDNISAICIDIDISDLIDVFDTFNKELAGYFFVLRINSNIPIYYPMILQSKYFSNIARFEFNIDTPFHVDELSVFNENVLPLLYKKYDNYFEDNQTRFIHGHYFKNAQSNNYAILPVGFFTDETQPSKVFHMLSIIYINLPTVMKSNIQNFQSSLYPRLIIQIFLFIIMGAILVLIAWYLIISIATNIVKPIRNLKYLIQGMKIKSSPNETEQKAISNEEESAFLNKNVMSESNERIKQENSKENLMEYDEETLELRSAEMNILFEILLKLKNVLSFTANSKYIFEKDGLVNFLNAKYIFKKVNNLKGEKVCDSNVGNLSLRCKKYDKAIFHIIESFRKIEGNNTMNILPKLEHDLEEEYSQMINILNHFLNTLSYKVNLASMHKNSKINKKVSTLNLLKSVMVETEKDLSDKPQPIINRENIDAKTKIKSKGGNILVESRYPKLLYAYKQFFKSFKKIIKENTNTRRGNENFSEGVGPSKNINISNSIISNDVYVIKERHSLETYETYLIKYVCESIESEDPRRTVEAILEYNEFLINFRLKAEEDFDQIYKFDLEKLSEAEKNIFPLSFHEKQLVNQIQTSKKEVLNKIITLFSLFERIYDILKDEINTPEHFKSFLDHLRNNKKENLEIVETPFKILSQKNYYLLGKTAKICGHYGKAIEYFHMSRRDEIICDASLIKKSIKQIVRIMENIKDEVENELESTDPYQKYVIINDEDDSKIKSDKKLKNKERSFERENLIDKKQRIEQYIIDNNNKLACFKLISKDIALLIDVSEKMASDPKKFSKALKAANNFFDMYTTTNDRFALFSYSSTVNPIIALTRKNFHTYDYVKNSIDNIQNDLLTVNGNSTRLIQKSCTCKAIETVYDYLIIKNSDLKPREKWIVVFTSSFEEDNTEEDKKVFELLRPNIQNGNDQWNEDFLKLIIIGINMDKANSNSINKIMNSFSPNRKSLYLDYENFGQLSESLKLYGDIQEDIDYPNERYESDKIK
jgi:hypothetical protein